MPDPFRFSQYCLAHVHCHPRDVESAIQTGADGLNFYIGTSAPCPGDPQTAPELLTPPHTIPLAARPANVKHG